MKMFRASWDEGGERELSADTWKIQDGWLHLQRQQPDGSMVVLLLPPSIATSVDIQEVDL